MSTCFKIFIYQNGKGRHSRDGLRDLAPWRNLRASSSEDHTNFSTASILRSLASPEKLPVHLDDVPSAFYWVVCSPSKES